MDQNEDESPQQVFIQSSENCDSQRTNCKVHGPRVPLMYLSEMNKAHGHRVSTKTASLPVYFSATLFLVFLFRLSLLGVPPHSYCGNSNSQLQQG